MRAGARDNIAWRSVPRSLLFFGLFLLSGLNSVSRDVIASISGLGWSAVLDLFGVSAILWAAMAAGLKILADDPHPAGVRRGDLWIGAVVVGAALLPSSVASMGAMTLLGAWGAATSPARSPVRRAAIIFLAVSTALLWGRLVLAVFSRPLLDLDALFVAALLGAEQHGNMLWFSDAPTRLIVAPGCSSMRGMSLALVLWATVNQLFEVRFGVKPALWLLAALVATIAVNVVRIGAMLRFPELLPELHHGWGFHLSMWAMLIAVTAICLFGARHEVFRRA